jgi:tetratricopeptide (TPR) repeat protein
MVAWQRPLAAIMAIGVTAASAGPSWGDGRSPQVIEINAIAQDAVDLDSLIQQANELFYRQDQYAEAARLYQQAIANGGNDRPDAVGPLAQCLMLLGKDTEAIPLLKRFANGSPGNETWLSRLALAEYRTGQYASAEKHLLMAIESWEAKRAADDLSDMQRVTLLEQQSYAYRQLLRTLIAQGKTDLALEWAERGRARSLVEVLMQQAVRQRDAETPLSVIDCPDRRPTAARSPAAGDFCDPRGD